jgi:flagellar basal-body rod protein FlgG
MSTRALKTAASGLYAQQLNIEIISNNIANVNTTSFKKNKAEFQDLMYQDEVVNPISTNLPGVDEKNIKIQVGNGVKPGAGQKIFTQGTITATSSNLDVAIDGDGFFQLKKADGSYVYSRDGSFKMNSEGKIITSSGQYLDPEITVSDDTKSLTISRDGVITAEMADGSSEVLGNMELVKFINPAGLKALGDNLYSETEGSGEPILGTPGSDGFGEVHQGYLETSNVDIVEEMISMITAQRAYEINSKTVKTVEEMMQMANNLKQS